MSYKTGARIIVRLDGLNCRATVVKVLSQDLYIIETAKERRIILSSQIIRELPKSTVLTLSKKKHTPMNKYADWGAEFQAIPRRALINGESVLFTRFTWQEDAQELILNYGSYSFKSVGAKDFNDAFTQVIRLVLESK